MISKEWQVQVKVKALEKEDVENFFWQIQGGHGSGIPVQGSIQKIETLGDGITKAKGVMLRGSGGGAGAILDEFVRRLSPENQELSISINQVSESGYKTFMEFLAKSYCKPSVEYAKSLLTITFSDEQIATYPEFASILCEFITEKG